MFGNKFYISIKNEDHQQGHNREFRVGEGQEITMEGNPIKVGKMF